MGTRSTRDHVEKVNQEGERWIEFVRVTLRLEGSKQSGGGWVVGLLPAAGTDSLDGVPAIMDSQKHQAVSERSWIPSADLTWVVIVPPGQPSVEKKVLEGPGRSWSGLVMSAE